MPTYRVYLRRPSTKPPVWDWSETIVRNNSGTALQDSYQHWVDSKPTPAVPPLDQCGSRVELRNARILNAAANDSSITPGQQAFIDAIQQKVSTMLSTRLDGTFQVVNYPSGFNYGITYGNNAYYNKATLRDIDTLLGLSDNGGLELTGAGFSGLYAQILPAVAFVFSQADQQTMQNQDTAASAQVASILTEFQNVGGVYTNPLPFGGKLQDVFNQLIKMYGSLSNIPNTMNALRNAIASYQATAGASYALHAKYYQATAYLAAALANTVSPSATNGGMQTDASSYYVGFTPEKLPTANQLIGGLNTTSNAVTVDISLSNFSSTSSQLSISGGFGFSIPIGDILNLSIGGSASYSVSKYASSATHVTMNINYPGVTLFASTPSILSTDNSTGWYANDILADVVSKTGHDATGFALQGSQFNVSELFGTGNTFSRLKTFVISQQPTIKMTFFGADTDSIVSDLKVNASAKLDLFGLFTLGSVSGSYNVQNVDTHSVAGAVVVTFGPPQISGTIPLQQQVCYVMGGVASYPPNNI
ncbi:MAG TPA: hypothetical protein VGS79_17905 [Puia sp.]|nr:hypothetical protein [Puia sp.]